MINNHIVPAIGRALGGNPTLPDYVTIRPDSMGTSSPEGRVPGTVDAVTGEIVGVEPPIVSASLSDEAVTFVITHELAHYHELSVRMARDIRVRPVRATQLWSEYFAQRVLWDCGGMPSGLFDTGGVKAAPDAGPSSGLGYLLAWLRAHHDATPQWLNAYEADKHEVLSILIPGLDPDGRFDALYRKFPEWDDADVRWVGIAFSLIDKVKVPQRGTRRRRR